MKGDNCFPEENHDIWQKRRKGMKGYNCWIQRIEPWFDPLDPTIVALCATMIVLLLFEYFCLNPFVWILLFESVKQQNNKTTNNNNNYCHPSNLSRSFCQRSNHDLPSSLFYVFVRDNCWIQRIEPWLRIAQQLLRIAQQLLRYAQPWLLLFYVFKQKKHNNYLYSFVWIHKTTTIINPVNRFLKVLCCFSVIVFSVFILIFSILCWCILKKVSAVPLCFL